MDSDTFGPKDMKYGQIAGNKHINAFIYRCFQHICGIDERKFVKKFRRQTHDSDQIMHTFRELVLGAYLSSIGFTVKYDYGVDGKTPDWCILDDKLEVIGIVELASFHIDKATEIEIKKQLEARNIACFWRDQNKNNVERLYHCIWNKAVEYRSLAKNLDVSYVVAIFGDFRAAVDLQEVRTCLFERKIGLFGVYPEVSGVLYFQDSFGRYYFNYTSNPNALKPINFPNGVF